MDTHSVEVSEEKHVLSNDTQVVQNYTKLPMSNKMEEMGPIKRKFPYHIFLIIVNEFCERFSYYGLRTVLIIYFTKFIMINDDTATAYYHAFTVICYFTPVIGAIISDGYIGKFRTIVYLSIVYLIGEIILCLTSFKPLGAPNLAGPLVGLLVIGIGTGGIKPCVSAFGGDQFLDDQKKHLNSFFSVFYMSINIGSVIASLITPIFRSSITCFGGDCYPLSFGVPTVLMFVAIIVFVVGKPFYYCKPVDKLQNVIGRLSKCIYYALKTKVTSKTKKAHWLDYAEDKFDAQFIYDAKQFAKVVYMFLPLPIFWALFDQQGSRWTLQATKMDTKLSSDSWIQADQIQSVNPILVIGFIPIFNWGIYPLFAKCNLFKKQLQRMSFGMLLAGIAFVTSAIVEYRIQATFMQKNSAPHVMQFVNLAPSNMIISSGDGFTQTIESLNQFNYMNTEDGAQKSLMLSYSTSNIQDYFTSSNDDYLKNTYFLYYDTAVDRIKFRTFQSSIKNEPAGKSKFRVYFFNVNGENADNYEVSSNIPGKSEVNIANLPTEFLYDDYEEVNPSKVDFKFKNKNTNQMIEESFILDNGATNTFILLNNENGLSLFKLIETYENQISFGYQIIQYFIITSAEIMFSISGLSFAYSQSPESMKSVLQAAWLLTVGFGNLIVVIVAEAHFFDNQLYEYVLFAGLIFLFTIIFAFMCYFYVYNDTVAPIADDEKDRREKFVNENKGFVNETKNN